MKIFFLYFWFPLIFLTNLNAQQKVSVIVIVDCDSLPENSSIYITGNDEQLGNWQPDFTKLSEIESGKWQKEILFKKGKNLEYKITRGSWESEALNDDGSLPTNHKLNVEKDTIVRIKINLWETSSKER